MYHSHQEEGDNRARRRGPGGTSPCAAHRRKKAQPHLNSHVASRFGSRTVGPYPKSQTPRLPYQYRRAAARGSIPWPAQGRGGSVARRPAAPHSPQNLARVVGRIRSIFIRLLAAAAAAELLCVSAAWLRTAVRCCRQAPSWRRRPPSGTLDPAVRIPVERPQTSDRRPLLQCAVLLACLGMQLHISV
jgi:hypothetical protein